MNYILRILALLFLHISFVNQGLYSQDSLVLCSQFHSSDTLKISIKYKDRISCINDEEWNYIQIFSIKDYVRVHSDNEDHFSEKQKSFRGSAIYDVCQFEKKGIETSVCGGSYGGHGVEAILEINGIEKRILYCKDKWDGIEELVNSIKKKMTNANNM